VTFVVLINGEPSDFFHSGRGLRQGCPLSPLLFILIMEGLSLALKRRQEEGLLTGIKVSRCIKILHLLFVDDVLIMTKDSIEEWKEINKVLTLFCSASDLQINAQKTTFLHFGVSQQVLDVLKSYYHYNFQDLSDRVQVSWIFLKMGRYKSDDWLWLLEKYEKRIRHWCNRWLSIGGRLVLIKVVLESQPVYWLALSNIPAMILQRIRQLIFGFLWTGCKKKKSFHLCNWNIIARPKLFGGWGLRNLLCFSRAMAANTLWRDLMHDGLWHRVLKSKYLPFVSVERWFCTVNTSLIKGSQSWSYIY
jgi:hypothetical protein